MVCIKEIGREMDDPKSNPEEPKTEFSKSDYERLAVCSMKKTVEKICSAIENQLIIFVLERKFGITGDDTDSSAIAKEANELFKPEKPLDGAAVDRMVSIVMKDAESGKFGGQSISGMAVTKGLMLFCQNFKEEGDSDV